METEHVITAEEANEAARQLMPGGGDTGIPVAAEPAEEPSAEETVQAEPEAAAPVEEAVEVQDDDLESLRSRRDELETQATASEERFQERLKAQQQRGAASQQILRDQYLRKSNAASRALDLLRATRSEAGASEADVDRAIQEMEGTMNPQSASYVAPQPQQTGLSMEDQTLVLNDFLDEKQMTAAEADEFGTWIQTQAGTVMSAPEQAVAIQSPGGFLRLAHNRYLSSVSEQDKATQRGNAVDAVRSVQRTQKAAARAASPARTAPTKQVAGGDQGIDMAELKDSDIADLLRQSVEQHR